MKISIEIKCDNAAFGDNAGGEVARILRKLAEQLDGRGTFPDDHTVSLYDHNGNRVGSFDVA